MSKLMKTRVNLRDGFKLDIPLYHSECHFFFFFFFFAKHLTLLKQKRVCSQCINDGECETLIKN